MTDIKNQKEQNMRIWKRVDMTNPDHTKAVSFGRKFTSINAQSQVMSATETFGPIGLGWGLKNEKFQPLVCDPNDPHYTLLVYTADFWYRENGCAAECAFPIAADIELFEETKNGWKRVDEPHKKVKTDALTKGLSLLGFNADIFLGMYDDNKYVTSVRNQLQHRQEQEQFGDSIDETIKELVAFGIDENQIKAVKSKLDAAKFLGVAGKFKTAFTIQNKFLDKQNKMKKPQVESFLSKLKSLVGQEAFDFNFSSANPILKLSEADFLELNKLASV